MIEFSAHGTIHALGELQTTLGKNGREYHKKTISIELYQLNSDYRNFLEAEAMNDSLNFLNNSGLSVGDNVIMHCAVSSKPFQDKNTGNERFFTSVKLKSIEKK